MALGLTQPLTEISTRDISWRRPVRWDDNLTFFMCWSSRNSRSLNLQACNGISLPLRRCV